LHDLLFSSKTRIEASDKWVPKEAILRHQARLRAELVRIQIKQGKSRKEDLARQAEGGEARYVRWNPNIDLHRSEDWSFSALESHLSKLGFVRVESPVWPVPRNQWFSDPHLPECLLVFAADTNWWVGDKWYEAGAVILQDKASCFPAKVLAHDWKTDQGDCLDAT
jgi:putative methyltransferase